MSSLPVYVFFIGGAALGALSYFGTFFFEIVWGKIRQAEQQSTEAMEGFQLPSGVVGFATIPQPTKAEEKTRKAERQREAARLKAEQEGFAKKVKLVMQVVLSLGLFGVAIYIILSTSFDEKASIGHTASWERSWDSGCGLRNNCSAIGDGCIGIVFEAPDSRDR